MEKQTVLVLGGGIGGLVAANKLRRSLGREHRVVLVDRRPRHSFTASYLWVLNGWRTAEQVEKELARLERKGIEFIQGEVAAIDAAAGRVSLGERQLDYDQLVVSLGADLDLGLVPGLPEACQDPHGYNLYELDGLTAAHQRLRSFESGRIVIAVCRMPYKCPAAPYEAALLVDSVLRARGVRDHCEVEVVSWEPQPMPVAGPAMGEAVLAMIEPRDIVFRPNASIVSVTPDERRLNLEGESAVNYDLLLAVPPHRCAQVVRDADLTGESGWVTVDPGTMATSWENLYVIGDATAIKLANGKLLPKAGVFAHKQAETVAAEIAAQIKGTPAAKPFGGEGYCFVEAGDGTAAFAQGDFYAKPDPAIDARKPSKLLHWSKIAFEKYWFWRYL